MRENPKFVRRFGQEINLNTWAICGMNLFLHDIDGAEIARGDTLLDPSSVSNLLSREIGGVKHPVNGPEALEAM